MKVILLQDIEKLGKKFEVKEVADGFAKNHLLPKKMVQPATKNALIWAQTQREIAAKNEEKELIEIQKKVSALDGREFVMEVKTGEKDQLFESVNSSKIAELLKENGIDADKKQIDLKEPIKELGDWRVKINFPHNLEAEIKITVAAEPE
ncbi:MAG: 50S ribosomal protein L9 [Candidatus Yanofskyibacterium parasiticum]|jgi:large subunit ribosomal protein L9|nr:MAG: 50S ribosomal protein L9 [Candidatus Yanofskybacteria bacterium]